MTDRRILIFSIACLPSLIYLFYINLSLAPGIRNDRFDKDFKEYYLAIAQSNNVTEHKLRKQISSLLDHRLYPDPNDPPAKYSWVGMLSGNDSISLTSGTLHFAYLLETGRSSKSTLIISSLILTSSLLLGISNITHNTLTWLFRFSLFPNKSYLIYKNDLFVKRNVGMDGQIRLLGTIKALIAFLPGWLFGLLVGSLSGELDIFFKNPLVPPYLVVSAHLYCVCAGGIVVIFIEQLVLFTLMRFDINVNKIYMDNILVATMGIVISTLIYRNGFGTTTSVTLGFLLFTFIRDGGFRNSSGKNIINHHSVKYGYSISFPTSWKRCSLLRSFISSGGQFAISHQTNRATLNISIGPLDPPEWSDKEKRAAALRSFLILSLGEKNQISILTSETFGNEINAVVAEYIQPGVIRSVPIHGLAGLISTYHNNLEYVIQWTALPDLKDEIVSILNSFEFQQ